MPEVIELEFHSKDVSDFQMSRLVRASLRKYSVPITAFVSDALIADDTCLGCLSITLSRRRPTTEPMVLYFAQVKFDRLGKRGGFGCSKLKTVITSSLASSEGSAE